MHIRIYIYNILSQDTFSQGIHVDNESLLKKPASVFVQIPCNLVINAEFSLRIEY